MQSYFQNYNEIGIDEAGRGTLIGNVVCGLVIWKKEYNFINGIELIKDSKKLSRKKREIAFQWIKKNIKDWSFGFATPQEVDNINILNATKLAINRGLEKFYNNINNIKDYTLIIDGLHWKDTDFNMKTISIIKGDDKFYSIASASIIAKVIHDQQIVELVNNNPNLNQYYLLNNYGYGTLKHRQAIYQYGYSDFHRKTFKLKKIDNINNNNINNNNINNNNIIKKIKMEYNNVKKSWLKIINKETKKEYYQDIKNILGGEIDKFEKTLESGI
jgi:ribonuclease HII